MDILIIATGLPDPSNSILGIFEYDQAKALAKKSNNVTFFGIDLRSLRRWRKWGIVSGQENNVKHYIINIPVGAVPDKILNGVGKIALRILYKSVYKNKKKPDLIHAHFTRMGAISSVIAHKYDIPLVVTEHYSGIMQERLKRGYEGTIKESYQSADKLIAVSSSLADRIRERFGFQCDIIPNVLYGDVFLRVNQQPHNQFCFVFTGSVVEGKGIKILCEAFLDVYETCKNVHLMVIGKGDLLDDCIKWCRENHLEKAVTFYGFLSRQKIAELYSVCDCFVMPSKLETFGVVYAEALAAGLPVIGTKCGGPEDFVDGDNGILVEVGNKAELVAAMKYMYENRLSYDSNVIRQGVMEKFSEEAITGQLMRAYQDVIRKR